MLPATSSTGAWAKVWCLLIHAEPSLLSDGGQGETPGAL